MLLKGWREGAMFVREGVEGERAMVVREGMEGGESNGC